MTSSLSILIRPITCSVPVCFKSHGQKEILEGVNDLTFSANSKRFLMYAIARAGSHQQAVETTSAIEIRALSSLSGWQLTRREAAFR